MNQSEIAKNIETCLKNYETFENRIIYSIEHNYWPLVYQGLYKQLGYEKLASRKFTSPEFKIFLKNNNFLGFVNEIYRTRLSNDGLKIIFELLGDPNLNFDDYESALKAFEKCNPKKDKNGEIHDTNAWSFGTKVLHFYNPEENPILDSLVRTNLHIVDMTYDICIYFQKATNDFVREHNDYFENFYKSERIKYELKKRHMTTDFPKMEIMDMALYEQIPP